MTTTPEEVRDKVLDDALDGSEEIQVGDRRVRKSTLEDRLAAAGAAEAATNGPFIKVGLKKREF